MLRFNYHIAKHLHVFVQKVLQLYANYNAVFSLGRTMTVPFSRQAAFHVTSKGMDNIWVSSSFGWVWVRLSGMRPSIMC
jgi:hypothetical protein